MLDLHRTADQHQQTRGCDLFLQMWHPRLGSRNSKTRSQTLFMPNSNSTYPPSRGTTRQLKMAGGSSRRQSARRHDWQHCKPWDGAKVRMDAFPEV
ncbi:hypothetical protein ACHAW6_001742 [Cyclotella cf. meneghiniana]